MVSRTETTLLLCISDNLIIFRWTFLSAKDNHSFDSTKMPSPQRCSGEPSLSQRRGFADSITSLRATSWTVSSAKANQRGSSVTPHMCYSKSPKAASSSSNGMTRRKDVWWLLVDSGDIVFICHIFQGKSVCFMEISYFCTLVWKKTALTIANFH